MGNDEDFIENVEKCSTQAQAIICNGLVNPGSMSGDKCDLRMCHQVCATFINDECNPEGLIKSVRHFLKRLNVKNERLLYADMVSTEYKNILQSTLEILKDVQKNCTDSTYFAEKGENCVDNEFEYAASTRDCGQVVKPHSDTLDDMQKEKRNNVKETTQYGFYNVSKILDKSETAVNEVFDAATEKNYPKLNKILNEGDVIDTDSPTGASTGGDN